MDLEEFKFIFYMEWAHRMLGRFIGLTFIVPGLYFASKGLLNKSMILRSLIVGSLIGCQGILGWYMVKSGLDDELLSNPYAVPRVSQYFLSAHLGSAFVIYALMLSTGAGIIASNRGYRLSPIPLHLKSFMRYTHFTTGFVFITALSGAFVAGLDAGLVFITNQDLQ